MSGIFYDLETSDSEPIGQILNYCFILVDKNYQAIRELSGEIRISRLQLPRAGAILANRVNVIEHQQRAQLEEAEALGEIHEFLTELAETSQAPLSLIGYNSGKFDLPFLRTSMIRKGLNPYAWKRQITDRDLLLAVRKLAVSDERFPRPNVPDADGKAKLSLRLETLAQHFGLLKGQQTHNSRDDTILSIELAKVLHKEFAMNILKYQAYEGGTREVSARKPEVTWTMHPNYDLSLPQRAITVPYTLLCSNANYALWVNLADFKSGQGRDSVHAIKKGGGSFFLAPEQEQSAEWIQTAQEAQLEFKKLDLSNYFTPTTCDIEQFIYRVDFSAREALERAIWAGDSSDLAKIPDRDTKALYLRHLLASYTWGGKQDSEMSTNLKQYALRRYGGKVVISKHPASSERPERYHATLAELLKEIDSALESSTSPEDTKLLKSLRGYYMNSDILRVAGKELLPDYDFSSDKSDKAADSTI